MLLGSAEIHASCKQGKPPKDKNLVEKIYLDPSKIEITNQQILVEIENVLVPAVALYSDPEGIYILAKRGREQGRCPEGYWECNTCRGCSPWITVECDWCGYD